MPAESGVADSSVTVRDVFARIFKDGGIHEVDKLIVPVSEILRLQDMDRR